YLKHVKWQSVFSSPSRRALHTAELLTSQSININLDNRIKEMNLGTLEGMTWEEIKKYNPKQYNYYWQTPHRFHLSSGEDFFDVKERVTQFLNNMSTQFSMGNVLIITHGVIIKMIETIVQNNELHQLWKTPHVKGAS